MLPHWVLVCHLIVEYSKTHLSVFSVSILCLLNPWLSLVVINNLLNIFWNIFVLIFQSLFCVKHALKHICPNISATLLPRQVLALRRQIDRAPKLLSPSSWTFSQEFYLHSAFLHEISHVKTNLFVWITDPLSLLYFVFKWKSYNKDIEIDIKIFFLTFCHSYDL